MVKKEKTQKYIRHLVLIAGLIGLSFAVGYISFYNPKSAYADHICCDCGATCSAELTRCAQGQCVCQSNKETPWTKQHISDEFTQHREWLIKMVFEAHVLPAMMLMAEQISTIAMHQVLVIGTFFDAKHQMEMQRLLAEKQAEIHKTYHPSVAMCEFGTNTRSIAASDRKADITQIAMATRSVQRQLLSGDAMSAGNADSDLRSRLDQLQKKYCNPDDMGGNFRNFCEGTDRKFYNRDIDYTANIDNRKTLEIDFTDGTLQEDEEAVLALSANLYGHYTMPRIPENMMADKDGKIGNKQLGAFGYMDIRALAAKRSVAQAAFAAQVAMRSQGEAGVKPYIENILKEMGIEQDDVDDMLKQNPSYFMQMELLTKKLYQQPKFYANLYDKPVNVDRQNVAMMAIGMMQRRDMYRSMLRSEAISAVLLETKLKVKEDLYSNEVGPFRQSPEILNLE
jgi:hypothetical protein